MIQDSGALHILDANNALSWVSRSGGSAQNPEKETMAEGGA